MCDPFFMLIVLEHMGRDYVVWDKAASIQFLKPGRGMVTATFHISPEQIAELRAQADREGKIEPLFNVDVMDEQRHRPAADCMLPEEFERYSKRLMSWIR